MRILFTSVGRRVELIQAFRSAAERLNVDLSIYGADCSSSAPALLFCDYTVFTPLIKSGDYIDFLKKYCLENQIDALIPTIDTDLLILSENRTSFGKTKVIISDYDKIALCRDKRLTAEFFTSVGLQTPDCCDDYRCYKNSYPAFIKPKDGSSSIDAYKVFNEESLQEISNRVSEYIVQPYISGKEYTVDVFCDFEGQPIYITPRERLAVRSGEVLKTRITQDNCIIGEIELLCRSFKPIGQITVQLIREENTGIDYYIEINPRFGGGAPLSMKAGADSAESLLRLLQNEKLSYVAYAAEDGAVYSRFDQSIRII